MAFLFKVEGKVVFPNPETLLISPFNKIWERDRTEGKTFALEELAYIEFMTSMKKSNPYRQYDDTRKETIVRDAVVTKEGWEPDDLIIQGMKQMKEFQTNGSSTYSYYLAVKKSAENLKEFFINVDINERNEKGAPVYKPREITSALNDTEKVLANLKGLEKKVEEELYETTKNRADKQISPFADPNSLKK